MPKKSQSENVIGERVKDLCAQRGISVTDLYYQVREYGITNNLPKPPSLSTFYTWMNGRRPTLPALKAIAYVLNVSVDYLLGETSPTSERLIDLTELPKECLKSVKAVEHTVVMPSGQKMRFISVKDGIAIPESENNVL